MADEKNVFGVGGVEGVRGGLHFFFWVMGWWNLIGWLGLGDGVEVGDEVGV